MTYDETCWPLNSLLTRLFEGGIKREDMFRINAIARRITRKHQNVRYHANFNGNSKYISPIGRAAAYRVWAQHEDAIDRPIGEKMLFADDIYQFRNELPLEWQSYCTPRANRLETLDWYTPTKN